MEWDTTLAYNQLLFNLYNTINYQCSKEKNGNLLMFPIMTQSL